MLLQVNQVTGWVLLHGLSADATAIYRRHFKIGLLQAGEAVLTILDEASGETLVYPPQNVVAVVLGGEADETLQLWYETARLDAPMVAHGPDTPAMLTDFSRRLGQAAEMNAGLMLRLAELRTVHEEVQNSYNALRNYVCEHGFIPPRLGFINLPEADGGASLPENPTEVLQPLPVDLRSLCGFSLHLAAEMPHTAEGRLLVDLLAAEDDAVCFSWQMPYNALPQGWVTFAFEQSEQFWPKTPVLRLRYETVTGPAPLFSLAQPQLRRDKAAWINGRQDVRSLAFKAWQSIPGAPLTISSQIWPAIPLNKKPVTRIELTVDETLVYSDILNQEAQDGFRRIALLPELRRIQVHPVNGQVSVACVFEVCPAGTANVVAEVETGSPNAGQIEYAIAVLSSEETQLVGQLGELPKGIAASDWVALPPNVIGTVTLPLPKALQRPGDLYLMTRLSPGQSSEYGWAQFLRFSFQGNFT